MVTLHGRALPTFSAFAIGSICRYSVARDFAISAPLKMTKSHSIFAAIGDTGDRDGKGDSP
jgi:hypothetical protein